MDRSIHDAWCIVAVLAITPLTHSSDLAAQSSLAGVYRSGSATVRLTGDGDATFSTPGGLIIASYRIAGDTLTLRDDRATATCAGGTGIYLWRLDADTLRLRLASDSCEARRSLVASDWTRVGGGLGSAAQALSGVVVTSEREVQDVQRAPVAITLLSAEETRDADVTRPQDLTTLVPGLLVGSLNGSSAMTYMRGVGNLAAAATQDPTVTYNFDGVYIARPTSTGGLFYDLERVEILKGPQGTLYGRNATGGAVNVLPRRPQLHEHGGEVSVAYGAYDNRNFEGWYNAPLGRHAAIRVSGQRVRHGAYMKDGTDDQDDWAGRVAIRFDASDALSLRVGADYYDQGGHGPGATPLGLDVSRRAGVASAEGGAFYEGQRVTIAGRTWQAMPAMQRSDNRHWGMNATLEWRTPAGQLTLIPAWRGGDIDATGSAVGNLYTFKEHNRQTSIEARLASKPHARVHVLAGAFYFQEDIDLSTRPYNQFNFSLQHPVLATTSLAPFSRVTVELKDGLRATIGARVTREDKDFEGTFESFSRICPPVPTAQCPNAQPFPADITSAPLTFPEGSVTATPVFDPADGTLTTGFRMLSVDAARFTRTTWRASAEYDLTRQAFLYGSYETGFKSGGFFFSSDSQVYQPEDVAALTLGVKSRLFGYRLKANVELFDWSYSNQQVSRIAVDSRGITSLATENIGRATIRGGETDLEYLLFEDTQLSVELQYLDAVFDSYEYETPASAGPPVSGCVVTPVTGAFQVNCSGRRAPYAPEWTVCLGARQGFQLPSGATLAARIRARYQSATLAGLDFLPEQNQNAHWLLNASLTFADASDRYSVALFGHNLTDETVVTNTFVVPFSTFVVGALRPPRTFGIRTSIRY